MGSPATLHKDGARLCGQQTPDEPAVVGISWPRPLTGRYCLGPGALLGLPTEPPPEPQLLGEACQPALCPDPQPSTPVHRGASLFLRLWLLHERNWRLWAPVPTPTAGGPCLGCPAGGGGAGGCRRCRCPLGPVGAYETRQVMRAPARS